LLPIRTSFDLQSATTATSQQPFLLRKAKRRKGRNTRATSRADAHFWMILRGNSLSKITGYHWPCRNCRQAQELSRSMETL
jgi:hypothetical protein